MKDIDETFGGAKIRRTILELIEMRTKPLQDRIDELERELHEPTEGIASDAAA